MFAGTACFDEAFGLVGNGPIVLCFFVTLNVRRGDNNEEGLSLNRMGKNVVYGTFCVDAPE